MGEIPYSTRLALLHFGLPAPVRGTTRVPMRVLWSLQRPPSERSEEMSLSGRQRRGAFKMCWFDTDLVVAHPIIEV